MRLVRLPVHAPYEISPEVAKRISWLRRRLLRWFARNGRSFPWREPGRTPYEVVVAEILLQRTTAAAVPRVYTGFLKRYPSWTALVYGRAEPLLDVNMARVLGRFLGPPEGTQARPRRALHAHALRLVRNKRFLEVNWAVLDFGAIVCRARRPLCQECPLQARCHYAMARQFQPTSSAGVL
jgi:adenine-specific DNA glycosylase